MGTPNVSPDGAFGPQLGWLWAKAALLAHMATAPAMRMSFILIMFGLLFWRFNVLFSSSQANEPRWEKLPTMARA